MLFCRSLAWLLVSLLLGADAPAPPGADDWKFDVIHRKHGKPFIGLVLEDAPDHVSFKCVSRKPGAPTIVITERLPRAEVDRLDLLNDDDRALMRRRLQGLAKERELLANQLKAIDPARGDGQGDSLDLRPHPWPPDPGVQALAYRSAYFHLISTARKEMVQLAAVQLEQVYAAYTRALPPRRTTAQPTVVLLLPSMVEYQALVRERGHNLLNPAFFDAARNQVVCASDLQRLAADLERIGRDHDRQREAIRLTEADLRKAYKDKVPPELLRRLDDDRKRMQAVEERNAAAFDQARRRLFERLYHEAFHAYLAAYVYPPGEGDLPRWLNEGLAQIFESAIIEVGELRVGHADRERYDALQTALKKGSLPPLGELLRSGPRQFAVSHAAERPASDRIYLASWALAFYLTFERRLLGTRQLDDYVQALRKGSDPATAFRDLVGQPLPEFEKEHFEYLKHLRPDGTARR